MLAGASAPVAAASAPVAAANAGLASPPALHLVPGRHPADGSARLHGGLARLVRAAQAGPLDWSAWLGFETAPAPLGQAVAVSLVLAADGGEAALRELLAAGGRIANRNGRNVEAYLPAPALSSLGGLSGIERAEPVIRPIPMGIVGLGDVVGEGVALHHADQWQAAGITGAGVKVGIIDGGFVGLTSRLGRELPSTVTARCYREVGRYSSTARSCESFTEHGTAVAETIADMAPGVSLYLADPISEQDLASSVAWMTSSGVKIINISLGFAYQGPGDGTSPANSVYSVLDAAVKGGALWVNAAGNAGEDGWTGTWKDEDHNGVLEFSGMDEGNSVVLAGGEPIVVSLRWNDAWGSSQNDYDLYVYGAGGSVPLAASEDVQNGTGDPVENLSFTPASSGPYRIVITRAGGTAASKLQLLVLTSEDATLQYRTAANTLPSPADSANPGMVTVGAVSFDTPDVIEPYSSRGPTTDGRVKPDLVAADCTATSAVNPFCGTSASAPYVTGAAAEVLSAKPSLTPVLLATWLRSHAVPLGGPSPNDTFGWGRLDLGQPPAPPAPTTMAFAAQPAAAVVGWPLVPAPSVRILDQDGVLVASGSGSTVPVSLALGANGGATLACPGGPTRNAVAGVATFTGCTISAAGAGVALVATAGSLPALTSAAFDVEPEGSAPAPAVTTAASASTVTWGSGVTLTAHLAAVPGVPLASSVAGRAVTIEKSANRTTWSVVGTAITDAEGSAPLTYRPVTNLYYRATFAGTPDLGPAAGGTVRVTVRQIAALRPTSRGATTTVARNQAVAFTTLVRPARPDVPAGTVTFEVFGLVGSTWRLVLSTNVRPDATGVAALTVTFDRPGRWAVRSIARPTPVNANSVWTPMEQFLVR